MPKSKNNEQNDQDEQANLPEEQKVIEEEAEYEELETEDEITDAFNAQPSVEDKFFYALNYGMRNNMIKQSGKYISEKERMELGMPKDPTVTFDMKNDTNFQSEMEKKIVAVYYYSVADKFFPEVGNEKKREVTIQGCKYFFESMGAVFAKFFVDIGKRYDEVSQLVPKEGNTPEDLHYKTKYLMKNGLSRDGLNLINSSYFS